MRGSVDDSLAPILNSTRVAMSQIQQIVDTHRDASAVMSACTPSRLNNEGDPGGIRARDTNYGPRFGDFFAYRDLLEGWLAAGEFDGLDLR